MLQTLLYTISAFQSTLPYGSDQLSHTKRHGTKKFQSTLPYGSDNILIYAQGYFNPRSLTGATRRHNKCFGKNVFQSTLPYGSDQDGNCVPFQESISIHVPSRERLSASTCAVLKRYFNPRSLAGATGCCWRRGRGIGHFNPRSLAGATGGRRRIDGRVPISIHAPSRERP